MSDRSHCVAGSVTAGCLSTLLGHPLDTIKVHQQANPRLSGASPLAVARNLTGGGGDVLRLFRGIGPPMASQIVMNTVMFAAFEDARGAARRSGLLDENASALVAGLLSGLVTACVSTPADRFKIRAQMSLSVGGGGRRVGGGGALPFVRTLYRGHTANLVREGVFTTVYLGLYDGISRAVEGGGRDDGGGRPPGAGTVALIGSFAGACAWICSYPFDAVKTVMQAGRGGATAGSAARSMYASGGWRAFWRGAGSSTLRAVLVTSSRMLAYVKTKEMLGGSVDGT